MDPWEDGRELRKELLDSLSFKQGQVRLEVGQSRHRATQKGSEAIGWLAHSPFHRWMMLPKTRHANLCSY